MDIFAGCGGLSEGLHQAGAAHSLWAIEYEAPAAEAYRLNHPDARVWCANCNVILAAAMAKAGQADDCLQSAEVRFHLPLLLLFISLFFCSFFSRIFPDRFQSAHLSLIKRWRTTCVRDCMHECTSLCACQWGGNVCRCGCVTQTERGGGVGRRGGSPEHIPAAWLTESPDAFWSDTFGVWSSVRPRWRVWTRRYSRACRGRARWSSCAGDRPARGTPE